ncbi:hypothetical protein L798_00733 [Zootermopsis nevadensis]|uniref:Uncharacterized protein n=1 Tax=Zootermopsis nevadensis TaxID=136037 RepID=A0A067RSM7_ZOONE|nr:hypothetical protein L798_00733 [Zootermopsis nevadensis]
MMLLVALDPVTVQVPHYRTNHSRIFSFHAAVSREPPRRLRDYAPSLQVQVSHIYRFQNPCKRFWYVGTSSKDKVQTQSLLSEQNTRTGKNSDTTHTEYLP